jgi:DNA-binding response OmpR family regulator
MTADREGRATPERVLVIDDEPQIRRTLELNLAARGYQVDLAPSGELALQMLRHHPDFLVRNRGRLVTQRQLLQEVWGPSYANETHYLRVFLAQVRRKLEPDSSTPKYFLTEPGMGYRFAG